ncbi:MAG: 2'-5' RNA ligase family protein [Mycobacteriales bacterium]
MPESPAAEPPDLRVRHDDARAPLPDAVQSALVVPIASMEALVGRWRAELDPAASWGVPAHVTVVAPFGLPDRLDDEVIDAVAAAVASIGAFDVTFDRVSWFGEEVLWVAPEPDSGFRELTGAVWRRFPQFPPYGGEHQGTVPHLTVGVRGPAGRMRAAAAAVTRSLPVRATVDVVRLLAGSPRTGGWGPIVDLPLRR